MDYGIDVSGYNTITNWPAVRQVGNSWAWAKATQGGDYTSPLFASQIAGARGAGLLPGAYHFPDPNVSVAANVAHFVAVANAAHALDAGCFVPLLDMEDDPADGIVWTPASANAFVPAFRDEFRRQTGVHQLCVYGSASWFATAKLDPAQWADSGVVLCIAQYTGVPGQVSWTHPRAAVHQYTNSAPTPGAKEPTDRSSTLGSWSAQQLTIGGSVSPAVSIKEDDDMGFWVKMTQPGPNGRAESSGYFEPTSGDLLILPLPDSVRAANAFSDLNAGGASDADALNRWNALVGRWDRNRAAAAQAFADALKADGIGLGGAGGDLTVSIGPMDLTGTLTPKTA